MEKIKLYEMPLQQKIAQMIIVRGTSFDQRFVELGIGGIFLSGSLSKEEYMNIISNYQKNTKIKLFVAADVEGYQHPFRNFYETTPFGSIKNEKEAYELGKNHGEIMNKLGFNLDFSPVVEIKDDVWPGRSFKGSLENIKGKISNYIKGLQEQKIIATAKHYPGGSMIKDPHKVKYEVEIYEDDLALFDEAIKANVGAIMIGHPIVHGAIDSNGKQCTISSEVISVLRKKFNGLIITDGISMEGLKISYPDFKRVYPDLINAGNDIILDSQHDSTYDKILERIAEVEKTIKEGRISEKEIDDHVRRILKIKNLL